MWPRSLRRTMLTPSSTAWWTQPLGMSCPQDTLPQTARLALTIVFRTFRHPLFGTRAVGSVTTLREAPNTQRLHNPCSCNWSWSLVSTDFIWISGIVSLSLWFGTLRSCLHSWVVLRQSSIDASCCPSPNQHLESHICSTSHTARLERGFWCTGSRSLYTVLRHELLSLTPDCRHFMNRWTFSHGRAPLHFTVSSSSTSSSPVRTEHRRQCHVAKCTDLPQSALPIGPSFHVSAFP